MTLRLFHAMIFCGLVLGQQSLYAVSATSSVAQKKKTAKVMNAQKQLALVVTAVITTAAGLFAIYKYGWFNDFLSQNTPVEPKKSVEPKENSIEVKQEEIESILPVPNEDVQPEQETVINTDTTTENEIQNVQNDQPKDEQQVIEQEQQLQHQHVQDDQQEKMDLVQAQKAFEAKHTEFHELCPEWMCTVQPRDCFKSKEDCIKTAIATLHKWLYRKEIALKEEEMKRAEKLIQLCEMDIYTKSKNA
jgi:hypothetical protein